jgi:hypothetical protein
MTEVLEEAKSQYLKNSLLMILEDLVGQPNELERVHWGLAMRNNHMESVRNWEVRPILWVVFACFFVFLLPSRALSQFVPGPPSLIPGQTATRLADGRLLLLGGEGVGGGINTASIWDPNTNSTIQFATRLRQGRSWHTATILPDGLVLVLGGVGNINQLATTAELFDPASQIFTDIASTGVTARARHTATLLSDGQVLIVGVLDQTDRRFRRRSCGTPSIRQQRASSHRRASGKATRPPCSPTVACCCGAAPMNRVLS